jgi:hypothetical protein
VKSIVSVCLACCLVGVTAFLSAQTPSAPAKPANSAQPSLPKNKPVQAEPEENPFAPPTPDELFRADSEARFKERIRQAAAAKRLKTLFPTEAVAKVDVEPERIASPLLAQYVPIFVCYQPLYFEDKNTERYGWYVPYVQPLLSTGRFYLKTAVLPFSILRQPPCTYECNTGLPMPGDPVPFRCRFFE